MSLTEREGALSASMIENAEVRNVPMTGNGDYFIRRGLGRKSRKLSHDGAPPDCVLASEWEDLRDATIAPKYAQFDATSLDGRIVGEALLDCVIGDPKVQAAGRWLCLECPKLSPLFKEGKFPIVVSDSRRRSNSIRNNHRPQYANVGYPALKENLQGLPRGTLSNPGRPLATFRPPRPPTSFEWVTKWPLVLDANELSRIFSSQYDVNASYEDDPTEGPIYHTAHALADRHRTFFDLLRARLLVAEGTLRDSGPQLQVPDTQWGRKDKYLDVETSDLFDKEGTAMWESTILRIPIQGRTTKPRRPRPADKVLEAELKKRGLADGRRGLTDTQIAHDLVDPRLTGEDFDRAFDRTRQQIKRYYQRRGRS
jgi:hypothetical protein